MKQIQIAMAMKQSPKQKHPKKKWSGKVTETSHALDLEDKVFTQSDPEAIAASLKRSAKRSHRRKGSPYQSAMSMINFYINRAGTNLSEKQKQVLEKSKDYLRIAFNKEGKKDRKVEAKH